MITKNSGKMKKWVREGTNKESITKQLQEWATGAHPTGEF